MSGARIRRFGCAFLVLALSTITFDVVDASPADAAPPCLPVACFPPITDAVKAIPGVGAVVELFGSVAGAAVGAAVDVLDVIGRGIAEGVGRLLTEVSQFFTVSTSPQVTIGAFVGEDGAYHKVAQLAALLIVLFIFLGVIQGMVAGDPTAMIVRTLRMVPPAVLAIYGFPWAVDQMVGLVDAVCASVLPTGATLGTIAEIFTANRIRFDVTAIILQLFAFVAAVVLYAELVVRNVLVTLVVAMAPLSFAAMVWPAARGAARKAVELVVALVLSKLAVWVALALGIDMVEAHAERLVPGGQSLGQMISGSAVLAVALFAPFVVWRLVPAVEGATVAHGLSRMPSRAAMTAAHTATTLRFLGAGGKGGRTPGGGGEEHPALADLPSRSLGSPGAAGSESAAPRGAESSGRTGQGAGAATGAGANTGGAGAVAGPVAAAAEGARKVKDRVTTSADAHTRSPTGPRGAGGGWSFRPEGD